MFGLRHFLTVFRFHSQANMSSAALNWLIVRSNNSFLLKKDNIAKPFSTVSSPAKYRIPRTLQLMIKFYHQDLWSAMMLFYLLFWVPTVHPATYPDWCCVLIDFMCFLYAGAQQPDQRQLVPLQRPGPQEDAGHRAREDRLLGPVQEEQVPGKRSDHIGHVFVDTTTKLGTHTKWCHFEPRAHDDYIHHPWY